MWHSFNDSYFFLQHIAEFPSLFYRKWKHELGKKLCFKDTHGNAIRVECEKTSYSGYITFGYEEMIEFYGLKSGGWLKVIYVGGDLFYMKVMDINSHNVHYPSIRRLPFPDHVKDRVAKHAFEVHEVKQEIIDFLADEEADDVGVVPNLNYVPIDNVANGDAEHGSGDENPIGGEMVEGEVAPVQAFSCEKLLTQYQARSNAVVFTYYLFFIQFLF